MRRPSPTRPTTWLFTAALLASALGSATACSSPRTDAADGRVPVVAGFYPLQFVAERVGGDAVSVTNLVEPGAEPHDQELSPRQVAQIAEAKLVVYLKGFQPEVDETVAQEARDRAFDVAEVEPLLDAAARTAHEGEEHAAEETGGKDPHVWLDPIRLATIGDGLTDRLARLDPERAEGYRARAAALRSDLEKLDKEYAEGLKACARKEIVVSHAAFGYLAKRYGLDQIAITGLTPENEPSAQRLAEVAEEARAHQATTIFFETLVSPRVAEAIAREVGARTAVLDPIEGLAPGASEDYFSVMRANLATLRPALGCS